MSNREGAADNGAWVKSKHKVLNEEIERRAFDAHSRNLYAFYVHGCLAFR